MPIAEYRLNGSWPLSGQLPFLSGPAPQLQFALILSSCITRQQPETAARRVSGCSGRRRNAQAPKFGLLDWKRQCEPRPAGR